MDYKKFIEKSFDIIDKSGQRVKFILNKEQQALIDSMTGKDVITKSRQIGFSSVILAIFTTDFLTKPNFRSVCISHEKEATKRLFDKVKFYITSLQDKGVAIDLLTDSRTELKNKNNGATFYIGTAGAKAFGRGDTINNAHCSELAFYDDPEKIFAAVLQAVPEQNSKVFLESTANGMNYFKTFWDKSKAKETGFKTHFFDNSFYSREFLEQKKKELGDLFPQEYPQTDTEAFLSSGNPFFDTKALAWYLANVTKPLQTFNSFYDLSL